MGTRQGRFPRRYMHWGWSMFTVSTVQFWTLLSSPDAHSLLCAAFPSLVKVFFSQENPFGVCFKLGNADAPNHCTETFGQPLCSFALGLGEASMGKMNGWLPRANPHWGWSLFPESTLPFMEEDPQCLFFAVLETVLKSPSQGLLCATLPQIVQKAFSGQIRFLFSGQDIWCGVQVSESSCTHTAHRVLGRPLAHLSRLGRCLVGKKARVASLRKPTLGLVFNH